MSVYDVLRCELAPDESDPLYRRRYYPRTTPYPETGYAVLSRALAEAAVTPVIYHTDSSQVKKAKQESSRAFTYAMNRNENSFVLIGSNGANTITAVFIEDLARLALNSFEKDIRATSDEYTDTVLEWPPYDREVVFNLGDAIALARQ